MIESMGEDDRARSTAIVGGIDDKSNALPYEPNRLGAGVYCLILTLMTLVQLVIHTARHLHIQQPSPYSIAPLSSPRQDNQAEMLQGELITAAFSVIWLLGAFRCLCLITGYIAWLSVMRSYTEQLQAIGKLNAWVWLYADICQVQWKSMM